MSSFMSSRKNGGVKNSPKMPPKIVEMNGHIKTSMPFKEQKPLANRIEEVCAIKEKFPSKMPVIIERYSKEKSLPVLKKIKYLIPEEMTMAQLLSMIRSKMQISKTQSIYIFVNNKGMASMTKTLAEVYAENKDEDGFLYVTYASQEAFGLQLKYL